ncbi:MAG: EamA family transporter, partial [Deltaproteobacteria bacterium]|nr:EamA family transporter [Deltaproteobacteria bacterium]
MNPSSEKPGSPSSFFIWSAMISVYIVWGSTYLAIRFAVQTMPPFLMAGVRFLIAGSVLYLFRKAMGDPRPSWKEWRSASVIGIFL